MGLQSNAKADEASKSVCGRPPGAVKQAAKPTGEATEAAEDAIRSAFRGRALNEDQGLLFPAAGAVSSL